MILKSKTKKNHKLKLSSSKNNKHLKIKKKSAVNKKEEVIVEAPKKSGRDIGVEVLRLLACFAVCTYHIRLFAMKTDGTISETYTILECSLAICVMSFFFITGFFIYNKKGNILTNWLKLIINTIINIIIPTIIVVIICIIFNDYFINIKSFDECIQNIDISHIVDVIIAGFKEFNAGPWPGTAAHLWYIFAYLYIVISYPLVQYILNKVPKKLILILIGYLILIGVVNDVWILDNDFTFHKLFDFIKKPVVYCMVGHFLYKDVLTKIRNKQSKYLIKDFPTFIAGIVIYIVSIILMFHFQYNYYVKYDVHIYVYSSWLSMFSMFLTIGFFLMVYNIDFDTMWNDSIKNMIFYFSKQTFIIYLIHYLIVIRFVCTGFQDAWHQDFTNAFQYVLYYLFYGFFIFAVSMAISMIITLIPNIIKMIINKVSKKLTLVEVDNGRKNIKKK